jgi:LuxR family transcriptional regulator, maltose regulon positive regulatory protein
MAEHTTPLLRTKLHPVRPQPGLVDRERIMTLLDEIPSRRLTLISASAGFGKTTAISAWLERSQYSAAWVSLDAGDNALNRFLNYVVVALQTVDPSIGTAVRRLIESNAMPATSVLVDALINDLAQLEKGLVLVLDDYHVINDGEIHDAMSYLLEHAPEQLHVIMTSRADPPFPLSRLRVRKQLLEIRASDLRFTVDEATELFQRTLPLDLNEQHVTALQKKTEGWIAGLQMAGLSLRGRGDVDGFIAAFTGADRYVLDYLIEEVLGSQSAGTQQVMLNLSVLDRFNGSLCEAVTGFADGAVLLEQLEEANLFLIPLDNRRDWYRYHKLFGDLLQHRLRQLQPEKVSELHKRASGWFGEQGLVIEASMHALHSGDREFLKSTLAKHWREILRETTIPELLLLIRDSLTIDEVLESSRLCMLRSMAAFQERDFNLMLRTLDAADALMPTETTPDEYAEMYGQNLVLRGARARDLGDNAEAVDCIQRAIAILPKRAPNAPDYISWTSEGMLLTILGSTFEQMREYDRAEVKYHESIRYGRAAEDNLTVLSSLGNLGRMLVRRGDYVGALRYAEEIESYDESDIVGMPRTLGIPKQIRMRIHLERYELDKALEQGKAGLAVADVIDQKLDLYRMMHSVYDAMGDVEAGLANIEETEKLPLNDSIAKFVIISQMMRAHWLWRQGRIDAAEQAIMLYHDWLDKVMTKKPFEITDNELPLVASAIANDVHVALAQGRADDALVSLGFLRSALEGADQALAIVEMNVLTAITRERARDIEGAHAALIDAVVRASGPEMIRPFVVEGPPVARLLQQVLGKRRAELAGVSADFLRKLIDACRIDEALELAPAVQARSLVGEDFQLTTREQEILSLLAMGYSNQKIADKLYVSVNTIKTHMSNLFDKLGARSRVEALARAREAELL